MLIRQERRIGIYTHLFIFSFCLIAISFVFDRPVEIWNGTVHILFSSSNLITDYIKLGGIGAAFLNSGTVTFLSVLMLRLHRVAMSGAAIAAVLTVCGFAFFGKNIYNSLPIMFGVYLYAVIQKIPFSRIALISLFATALSPLVSELSFGLGLPIWQGVLIGCLSGILIGLSMPPLSEAFLRFHNGYNLFNIGFTAGIIGMFATGILRMFNLKVETVSIISEGNQIALSFIILSVIASVFVVGLYHNGWSFSFYRELMQKSGILLSDFIISCGYGITMINVAIMGFLSWLYVILIGCELNGATLGAIFTVMGFSACGNHPRNTLPVIAGAILASFLNVYERDSTLAVITVLFGSALAPIAGHYGIVAGLIAGFTHVSMVMNISYLHGGMNLYNNGFSGGFIAAALVPLFDAVRKRRAGV